MYEKIMFIAYWVGEHGAMVLMRYPVESCAGMFLLMLWTCYLGVRRAKQ